MEKQLKGLDDIASGVVISSRVRLARNLKYNNFPVKIKEKGIVEEVTKKVFDSLLKQGSFKIYKNEDTEKIQLELLKEQHLISKELIKKENAASIINDEKTISVMINEEDFIREQTLRKGLKLEESYCAINFIDDLISEKVPFAFDTEKGYLTSCATNLGTGMRASVMMFLPALTITGTISSVIQALAKKGLTVRGVYGEGSSATGYMYQISNQSTLGLKETDIINNVNKAVVELCNSEKLTRINLLKHNAIEMNDRANRAYGILTHCKRLSSDEFMRLIAEVKLGAYLDIIKIKNTDKILDIINNSQPANIIVNSKMDLNAIERDAYRAEYVSQALRKLIHN